MRSIFFDRFLLIFAVVCLVASATRTATAHGTDHRILDPTSAIVLEFIYSDNQPMRYAEVLIFPPDHDKFEYQNGRTDMNGRFAFYPTTAGQWRIQADDGTGHLERVTIDITSDGSGHTNQRDITSYSDMSGHTHTHDGLSRSWKIILGISLILNFFMGIYLLKTKKS